MSDAAEIAQVVLMTLGAQQILSAPGEAVAEHLKARIRARLDRTLVKTKEKTGGSPHSVSDRVAAKVLNEAAFTDDDLTLEYLAGVMAASDPEDDTGAAVVAQIGRLSALQLRLHYVIYRELRRLWPPDKPMNLYMEQEAKNAGVRLTVDDLLGVIGPEGLGLLGSTVPALVREGLLNGQFEFSPEGDDPPKITLRVRPSGVGAGLFLWGHGVHAIAHALFDPSIVIEPPDVPATPGASLLTPPAAQAPRPEPIN